VSSLSTVEDIKKALKRLVAVEVVVEGWAPAAVNETSFEHLSRM
jgi:hypothetical protein